MDATLVQERTEKTISLILSSKTAFRNELDSSFLHFLENQNGILANISNVFVLHGNARYSLDYVFQKKLIVFNFQLNYISKTNSYLRECHAKLNENDLIAGKVELMEANHTILWEKHSSLVYRLLIIIEFIFKRLLPKLPVFSDLYEKLHLLKKQVLSKCEVLGRLIYNGFEIIATQEIDNILYFLCNKSNKPNDQKVNRGIFFKQRRVGKDGKTFNFYKLRTMHPYAEFIQNYLIGKNQLSTTGKVNGDFRVADWGKFFRRNWLDEVPGLINLLKGDIRLFGVRPLSRGFFELYPEEIQKERVKMKPGLIPPYYSDLPNSIEEVIESERRYLARRKEAPLRTDIEYFLRAMKNILLKGARSA